MAEWMTRVVLENWREDDVYDSVSGLVEAETQEEAFEKILLRDGWTIVRWENRSDMSFPLWGQPQESGSLWTINWTNAEPFDTWLATQRSGQQALHTKWEEFKLVQSLKGINGATTA